MGHWVNECFQGAGMQGFQKPIVDDSFIVDGVGALGRMQSERGLTYVEISLAGHQYVVVSHRYICANHTDVRRVPGYSPVVSART